MRLRRAALLHDPVDRVFEVFVSDEVFEKWLGLFALEDIEKEGLPNRRPEPLNDRVSGFCFVNGDGLFLVVAILGQDIVHGSDLGQPGPFLCEGELERVLFVSMSTESLKSWFDFHLFSIPGNAIGERCSCYLHVGRFESCSWSHGLVAKQEGRRLQPSHRRCNSDRDLE